jgi:hypothetical protein
MSALITDINLPDPDEFYEALLNTHIDLTPKQSEALNARLMHCPIHEKSEKVACSPPS